MNILARSFGSGVIKSDWISKNEPTLSSWSFDCKLCEVRSETRISMSRSRGLCRVRTSARNLWSISSPLRTRRSISVRNVHSAASLQLITSGKASFISCFTRESRPAQAKVSIALRRSWSLSVAAPLALRPFLVVLNTWRKEPDVS